MTREVVSHRADLQENLQNADCVGFVFGHDNWSEARERVKFGGAYTQLSLSDPLEDGDIVFSGIMSNTTHVAIVRGGRIIGKENRVGDVVAKDIEDYHQEGFHVQIYRRNKISLNQSNDPFHID